ncbi:FAD:protein FMN transferase [Myroides fluvii]|uniref:FAD:protein FMN transferase n=1 Tax=Myroides fluvii TaxID=2572594 RepID=UPI00131CCFC0|nr:FAD:protein FMN transferase [Myroides fluvii]
MSSIFTRSFFLMGCHFDLTLVADEVSVADRLMEGAIAEMKRIEYLLSEWIPTTPVSIVNANAGLQPVSVPDELLQLTTRALNFSKLTDGAFDITLAGLNQIWIYDGTMSRVPSPAKLKEAIRYVGYQQVQLDCEKQTLFLRQKKMKIGFGSIGKAYAADCAKALLLAQGVEAGIVNASGDMAVWGVQPDGKPWTVGIVNPLNKEKVFATIPIQDGAVVTSGTYEKYALINNKKYSHIIDPRTGIPTTEIASVTVFAPKAEMANGISTSIAVMGIQTGLHFVNQIPAVRCVIVDHAGNVFTSNNIKTNKI